MAETEWTEWTRVWLVAQNPAGEFQIVSFPGQHVPEHRQWCIKRWHSMREMVPEDKVYTTEQQANARLKELLDARSKT